MASVPSSDVQDAFRAPTARIVRRVEIYEQDGITPWRKDLWPRLLVGGSVSIDYDRDERRNFDIELDNSEGFLDPQAGGLYYDKIFQVYYGIKLNQQDREVRVAIIEETNAAGQANALKDMLYTAGITQVYTLLRAARYDEVEDYDVLIAISNTNTTKYALLDEAHQRGKGIITCTLQSTAAQLPYVLGNTATGTVTSTGPRDTLPNPSLVHPVMNGWAAWQMKQTPTYRKILNPATGAKTAATMSDSANGATLGVVIQETVDKPKWAHIQQVQFKLSEFTARADFDNAARFFASTVSWVNPFVPKAEWEASIGKFLADGMSDSGDMNDRIKVVGRDLTKRLLNSKLAAATTFKSSDRIEAVIKAVAANAGIFDVSLPTTNKSIGKDITWERGTARWEIIKELANTNNYEVYFDADGFLTMREYRDPLLTPPTLVLSVGEEGNLVSRSARSSDSRLFNHIIVVGESSDSTVPPVYAEAINDNPASSSNRAEIGDRVNIVNSSLVTTVTQAQELADATLAVSALEEFELNFVATLIPWIEPGEIVEMLDTFSEYWGPDRYLLTSLTLPLDLSPMSGTGKRILKVE